MFDPDRLGKIDKWDGGTESTSCALGDANDVAITERMCMFDRDVLAPCVCKGP